MTRALTQFVALLLAMLVGAACGYVEGWDDAAVHYGQPVALCPNYDSIRVSATRTVPMRCGDTTAVTFGYVR